jgi:hypothetical protein
VSYKLASKLKKAGFPQREGWYISKENLLYKEAGRCPDPYLPKPEEIEEEIRKFPADLVRRWENWMEMEGMFDSDGEMQRREIMARAWLKIKEAWTQQQSSTASN